MNRISIHTVFVPLLILIGFLLFYPGLHFELIHSIDDDWLITENNLIQTLNWNTVRTIFLNDTRDCFYYPFFFLSLALDIYIFGLSPYWIKLHNLLLHLGSALLYISLLRRLGISSKASLIALAFFVFHPLQVENFVWAACRRQVLVQFWMLCSFHAWLSLIRAGCFRTRLISVVFLTISFVAALLSKFLAVGGFGFFVITLLLSRRARNQLGRFMPVLLLLLVLAGLAYFMNYRVAKFNTILRDFEYRAYEHPGIVLQSFWQYVQWLFWPMDVVLFYPPALAGEVYAGSALAKALGGILILAVIPVCFLVLRAKQFLMAWIWFVAGVILTTDVMLINADLPFTASSRYFYLGSGGLFLLFGLFLSQFSWFKSFWGVGVITVSLALAGRSQLFHWSDSITLLKYNMKRAPNREAANRLALDLWLAGHSNSAISLLRDAEQLDEELTINYPYYTRLDLAAVRKYSGDTTVAEAMVFEALLADVESVKDRQQLWSCVKQKPFHLKPPFDYRNYEGYVQWRDNILKNCGLNKKKHRI